MLTKSQEKFSPKNRIATKNRREDFSRGNAPFSKRYYLSPCVLFTDIEAPYELLFVPAIIVFVEYKQDLIWKQRHA